MTTATDPKTDPVTGPLQILLGTPDTELSTREIARQLHVSQPTVVRRIQQARAVWDRTRRRQFWRDVMFVLLTLSAIVTATSMAIVAASHL
jgi:HTH domain